MAKTATTSTTEVTSVERIETKRMYIRFVVTAMMFGLAVWLYNREDAKMASLIIGAITGYWLK